MLPITYIARGELTSPKFGTAFALGCGGEVTQEVDMPEGPTAFFGSPKHFQVVEHAKEHGLDFYYGDHAYFQRGRYYRVTKNALQHTGEGLSDGSRFRRLGVRVLPWKASSARGPDILLCPNSDKFFSFFGTTKDLWVRETVAELRKYTDRPIKVKMKSDPRALHLYFPSVWAIIVYTSNCAIDAAVHGLPSFTTKQCAGSIIGSSDLSLVENPLMPDRQNPFNVLADSQWTLDEIREGDCWKVIGDNQ